MPGERTPDTTPPGRGGSSDDDISLREHMQRQIDAAARYDRQEVERMQVYFERVIDDMRALLDERFRAQQNAVEELKTTTTQRFEAVNEFRAQLNDQSRTFISRDESLARHDRTAIQLAEMASRNEADLRNLRDRHDQDVAQINSRLDLGQGRNAGLDKAWGYIIGLVGLAGGIVALVIATR